MNMKLNDLSLKKIVLSLLALPCSLISIFGMSKESILPQMVEENRLLLSSILIYYLEIEKNVSTHNYL